MPNFTVYNTLTGEVRCTGTMALTEWCLAQAGPGESVHLGRAPIGTYIKDDAPVDLPPRPSEAHVFDWQAHSWYDPRSIDELKAALKADIAQRRWTLETGGITLASGVRIKTGREDRAAFRAAMADMQEQSLGVIDFKADSGFVSLTLDQAQEVATAVNEHVQACFSAGCYGGSCPSGGGARPGRGLRNGCWCGEQALCSARRRVGG